MHNERELTIDELDAVSGGSANNLPKDYAAGCTFVCPTGDGGGGSGGGGGGGGTKDPIGAWNDLLHQYGLA